MSRSRLPQPPTTTRGSARPLPPEPISSSGSDDVPPPLPSRPAPHRGGYIPPPPIQNGSPPVEEIPPNDYLEPDDWCDEGPAPPGLPPRNFSPTLSAEDTYEEPEQNIMPPPPPRSVAPARSAAPAVQEGEIYDDLEEGDQQPEPKQQNGYTQDEVYDQCDVAQNEEIEPELYQVPDEIPHQSSPQLPPPPPMKEPEPEDEPEDSGLYEFVPETKVETNARNVPPPPMNNPPSRSQMPVPGIPQPPLPKRPTPQKERPPSPPDDDGAPVLPGRPGAGGSKPPKTRQLSGEGPVMPAFSSELIGNKIAQLKKVNSREKPDTEDKADKVETDMPEADSVRNRILMFKQQGSTDFSTSSTPEEGIMSHIAMGKLALKPVARTRNRTPSPKPQYDHSPSKPFLPVKPTMSIASSNTSSNSSSSPVPISSRNLGPPPPPPTHSLPPYVSKPKMEEPPPPPPPPAVEHSPAPAHVKMPPPPPVSQDECDDVYDDGMSYIKDPMTQHEWYHGEIERSESDGRLKQIGQDGTFLVRKSRQGGQTQPYTLVVLYQNHVYNLKIRTRSDDQVALGEVKSDELAFKDVPTLISHHRSNDVILVNKMEQKQYTTLLKKFPVAINR